MVFSPSKILTREEVTMDSKVDLARRAKSMIIEAGADGINVSVLRDRLGLATGPASSSRFSAVMSIVRADKSRFERIADRYYYRN